MAYRTGLCHSHSRHGHYGYHGPGHSSGQLAMVLISYKCLKNSKSVVCLQIKE